MKKCGLLLSLFAGICASSLRADSIVLDFPSSTSTEVGPGCGGPGPPLTLGGCFITGDNVSETFTATGLADTDSSNWQFTVVDDTVGSPTNTFAALINGTQVGTFSYVGTASGPETNVPFNLNFSYAPISGPDYTLEILATSTVPPGDLTWDVDTDGAVTLSSSAPAAAPEPGSVWLMVTALAAFGVYRLRGYRSIPIR